MSNEVKLRLEKREDPFDPDNSRLIATTDDYLSRDQRLSVVVTYNNICGNCLVRGDCKPKLWHRRSVKGKEIHGDLVGGLFCSLPLVRQTG